MKSKIILFITVIVLFLCIIYFVIQNGIKTTIIQPTAPINTEKDISKDKPLTSLVFKGILKKEKIPVELELGNTWYWMYFDKPFLLENNASGRPQYMDKLQVIPSQNNTISIDKLLGKHIQIKGNLTWGYAESNVIQIESISEVK
jgi:hypothetical protein